MSSFSLQIKNIVNGDEYYSPQNVVDMIVPYILRGGGEQSGVRLTQKTVGMYRPSRR